MHTIGDLYFSILFIEYATNMLHSIITSTLILTQRSSDVFFIQVVLYFLTVGATNQRFFSF